MESATSHCPCSHFPGKRQDSLSCLCSYIYIQIATAIQRNSWMERVPSLTASVTKQRPTSVRTCALLLHGISTAASRDPCRNGRRHSSASSSGQRVLTPWWPRHADMVLHCLQRCLNLKSLVAGPQIQCSEFPEAVPAALWQEHRNTIYPTSTTKHALCTIPNAMQPAKN